MDDHPSIGLLLCKSKNDLVAEYALKDMSKPMGVSAYKVTSSLPEELQRQLPSIEDIEKRIQREELHRNVTCHPCIHKTKFAGMVNSKTKFMEALYEEDCIYNAMYSASM